MKKIVMSMCVAVFASLCFYIGYSKGQDVRIPWQQGRSVESLVKARQALNGEPTIATGTLKLRTEVPGAEFLTCKYVLVDGQTIIGLETGDFIKPIVNKKVAVLGVFLWMKGFDKNENTPFCYITGDKIKDLTAVDKEEELFEEGDE